MPGFKTATKDGVQQTGFVFAKDASSQEVKKIATSADFQVGLSNLPKDLTVTGKATFTQGLSGSLTRLTDDTSYLVAGDNITITSASNGQVTITGATKAPVDATYVVFSSNSTLTSERIITAGSGITITDGGAGGSLTIAATGGGTGDVVGPASATDNAVVRFDLTTGKLIQNSAVTIADTTGNITTPGDIAVNGGDITTTAATFNIANTNATTLNVGGAASSINMGLSTALATIGNAEIGAWPGGTAYAVFQHKDVPDTNSYALIQTFNGNTFLNSVSGKSIVLRNYNNTIGTLDNNTISLTGQTGVATTTTIGNTFDTSSTTINAGSGSIDIGTTDSARSINIGTAQGAAQTITIGNKGLFSETVILAGSSFFGVGGRILLSGSTATTYTIGGETGTGTITIGRSTETYSINIGLQAANTSGQIQTINVGHFSATGGSKTVNVRGDIIKIADTGGYVEICGGYGSTGVTISTAGNIETNGTLTVDSTSILTGNVTFGGNIVADANENKSIFTTVTSNTITIGGPSSTLAAAGSLTVGGGYGSAGVSISTNGVIEADGNLTVDGTSINLGTTSVSRTINIGTGGAVQTINLGTSANANIISLGSNAAQSIGINGGDALNLYADAGTITMDSGGSGGTGAINVGTFGYAQTISIGNTTGATSLALRAGTGGITLETATTASSNLTVTGDVAVNGGDITTTSATFNLANAASTLNLGTTGIIRTVNIGTGTGLSNTQTINIGTFSTNAATIRIGNYGSTPASVTTIHGDTLNLNATTTVGTTNICAAGASLGFFGVAASTQYTTTGTTLGFTAGVGTAARVDSTYTGNNGTKAYTVGDIVRALKSYGLLDVS